MRWYWVIDYDDSVENPFVASIGDLKGIEDWELREGLPIHKWDSLASIKATAIEEDGDPHDVLQTYLGVPIYSGALQRAVNKAGITGIQYLPIRVLRHDGAEIAGFAVANIINKVAALDFEQSNYTLYGADWPIEDRRGNVSSVIRPVLLASALNGHHIVRLAEFTSPVYVSELFKDVFEEGGFTGYMFREVEVMESALR